MSYGPSTRPAVSSGQHAQARRRARGWRLPHTSRFALAALGCTREEAPAAAAAWAELPWSADGPGAPTGAGSLPAQTAP